LQDVYRLGGIPKEIFHDPDIKSYLLPILRNDFLLTELYNKKVELVCPLTVYAGDQDIPSPKELERRKEIKA
jgi:medium-chain acyl-[acyl-carrier-protein] hydrolase